MADIFNIHHPMFWIFWSVVASVPLTVLTERWILSWSWVQRVRAARLNNKKEAA